jgi:hypothetical protein
MRHIILALNTVLTRILLSSLCLRKLNLNAYQTCHYLFFISGVHVWLNIYGIFDTYTLFGYRASFV